MLADRGVSMYEILNGDTRVGPIYPSLAVAKYAFTEMYNLETDPLGQALMLSWRCRKDYGKKTTMLKPLFYCEGTVYFYSKIWCAYDYNWKKYYATEEYSGRIHGLERDVDGRTYSKYNSACVLVTPVYKRSWVGKTIRAYMQRNMRGDMVYKEFVHLSNEGLYP